MRFCAWPASPGIPRGAPQMPPAPLRHDRLLRSWQRPPRPSPWAPGGRSPPTSRAWRPLPAGTAKALLGGLPVILPLPDSPHSTCPARWAGSDGLQEGEELVRAGNAGTDAAEAPGVARGGRELPHPLSRQQRGPEEPRRPSGAQGALRRQEQAVGPATRRRSPPQPGREGARPPRRLADTGVQKRRGRRASPAPALA